MKSNPADIDSRSARAQELIDNPLWWNGPEFPWNSCEDWDSVNDNPSIPPDDPEDPRAKAIICTGLFDIFLQLGPSEESDCCLSPTSTEIPKDSWPVPSQGKERKGTKQRDYQLSRHYNAPSCKLSRWRRAKPIERKFGCLEMYGGRELP